MYIVKHQNYFDSTKTEIKKFYGKNAQDNAFSYAKDKYNNYWMTLDVRGFETIGGKETGRGFKFSKNK